MKRAVQNWNVYCGRRSVRIFPRKLNRFRVLFLRFFAFIIETFLKISIIGQTDHAITPSPPPKKKKKKITSLARVIAFV